MEQIINFFQGFRRDAHPMAMMVGVMGALSSFYQDTLDINDAHQRQEATRRMLKLGKGSIFFTGASASKKGFAKSSAFAMGKFGLRGLAQSLARELQPRNIHICHFIIDGIIKDNSLSQKTNDNQLDPDEIAKNYLNVFSKRSKFFFT